MLFRSLTEFGTGPSAPTMLSASEVGAGALLLAETTPAEADRFVIRALGALADPGDPRSCELLQTAHAYLSSRGSRKAAAALRVHENTIRYRLARFAELTGLDVLTDTSAQVTTQVALLILYLRGQIGSSARGHAERPIGLSPLFGGADVGGDRVGGGGCVGQAGGDRAEVHRQVG